MRYRYSKDIVYNNFPWPIITNKQKEKIEVLANNILEIRASLSEYTLADMYDPITMPNNLLKAHLKLDKEVLKIYNIPTNSSDEDILSNLFNKYEEIVNS